MKNLNTRPLFRYTYHLDCLVFEWFLILGVRPSNRHLNFFYNSGNRRYPRSRCRRQEETTQERKERRYRQIRRQNPNWRQWKWPTFGWRLFRRPRAVRWVSIFLLDEVEPTSAQGDRKCQVLASYTHSGSFKFTSFFYLFIMGDYMGLTFVRYVPVNHWNWNLKLFIFTLIIWN